MGQMRKGRIFPSPFKGHDGLAGNNPKGWDREGDLPPGAGPETLPRSVLTVSVSQIHESGRAAAATGAVVGAVGVKLGSVLEGNAEGAGFRIIEGKALENRGAELPLPTWEADALAVDVTRADPLKRFASSSLAQAANRTIPAKACLRRELRGAAQSLSSTCIWCVLNTGTFIGIAN